jgi:hypothetical protein
MSISQQLQGDRYSAEIWEEDIVSIVVFFAFEAGRG